MEIIQAFLLGIIQGLSEFLPISSSAHIVFVANIYALFAGDTVNWESSEQAFMSIMLHFGTLSAILVYFRRELWRITKEFFKAIYKRDFS